MSSDLTPIWVEPSFSIYYFDIVYSYPKILEIDFLVVFKGGLLSIEIERKRKLKDAVAKSLKYFVNGACRIPTIYLIDDSIANDGTPKLSEISLSTPSLVDKSKISKIFKCSEFRELLKKSRDCIFNKMIHERKQLFTINNFIRTLLIYGSPLICRILLDRNGILKHVIDSFGLVQMNVELIQQAKLLKGGDVNIEKYCKEVDNQYKECKSEEDSALTIKSMIVIVPILGSKYFHKRLKEFIERSDVREILLSLEKLVFVYTYESRGDAERIISIIKDCFKEKSSTIEEKIVKREEIAETVKNLAVNQLPRDVCVLIIGEIPKRELLKLLDLPQHNVRIQTVTWRPSICEEALREHITTILDEDSIRDGSCNREIEKVELYAVEI